MKRHLLVPLLALAALALAGGAAATPQSASLTIRHEVEGCHAWALGSGSYKASQSIDLARGSALVVTNNDVMPHQLVQLSGPRVHMKNLRPRSGMSMGLRGPFGPGMMGRMGAGARIVFAHPGTYRFTTKAGEDYMDGMKTVGEDNVLKLTVTVS